MSSSSGWSDDGSNSCDAESKAHVEGVLNAYFAQRLGCPTRQRPTRRRHDLKPRGSPASTVRDTEKPAVTAIAGAAASTSATCDVSRKRMRLSLHESLAQALNTNGAAGHLTPRQLQKIVCGIETVLKGTEDAAEVAYGLVVNLSDPLNDELRQNVLTGRVAPSQLVAMDEEQLLNPRLRAAREQKRQERMEQKTSDFVEKMSSTLTYMFTCPSCNGKECFAQFRSTDFVKWQGDDPTPTLLRCRRCHHSFRA